MNLDKFHRVNSGDESLSISEAGSYEIVCENGEDIHLYRTIAGLHFVFKLETLGGLGEGTFVLHYETEEYDVGVVGLDQNSIKQIGDSITILLQEGVSQHGDLLKVVEITPSDDGHRASEVEDCVDKILSHKNNEMSRESLIEEFPGGEIFDRYYDLFGDSYELSDKSPQDRNRLARARLFKRHLRTFLPDWEICKEDGFQFSIQRIVK